MYTVGRLARRFGLSRSALLYYDRIGILRPSCHVQGEYRQYSEQDAQRLEQIMLYRRAGLSLAEIAEVLEAPQNRVAQALESRLAELSDEIRDLREQQRLILGLLGSGKLPEDGMLDKAAWVELLRASGFSEEDMRAWHREFERRSPEKHERFLRMLCIPRDEIALIRAYAAGPHRIKNILESSESHMKYLYKLFEGLERLGPGSSECTGRALAAVPGLPPAPRILDIGCGTGAQTMDLLANSAAQITAVDTHQPFLDLLLARAARAGHADRVTARVADMRSLGADLGLEPGMFDLLWSEGALYIMGLAEALSVLRGSLRSGQCLALSECVWTVDAPCRELRDFWAEGYPEMRDVPACLALARDKGWEVLDHFLIGEECWRDFYAPLEVRTLEFRERFADEPEACAVGEATLREIALFRAHPGTWDYLFMVLRKA